MKEPQNTDTKPKQIRRTPNIPKKPQKGSKFNIFWVYAAIIVALIAAQVLFSTDSVKNVDYKVFESEMLLKGNVKRILSYKSDDIVISEVFIKDDKVEDPAYKKYKSKSAFNTGTNKGPLVTFTSPSTDALDKRLEASQTNAKIPLDQQLKSETTSKSSPWSGLFVNIVIPLLLIIGLWIFMMRRMGGGGGGGGGQIFNIGKSKATLFDKESQVNITFNDVAGLTEAKVEVMEIVDFLKNPKKYTNLGGKIPKGALLVGAPGTGKTLLAKAVAGEAQVPFFSLSGSDFVEMFVGVGASRVRDLFKQAKDKAPCIIFIDEIDAIGRARGKGSMMGGNDERENTLNQLLVEMDGFGTDSGIIIMGATNRADVLDSALLRPGRFDRQIYVDMPDINERKEIFNVHLKPIKLEENIDINFLAKQTPGFSGADIANLCNEAALIAARKTHESVTKQDFLDAVDRIIGGLEKKNKIITKEEKKAIAFHEAGHATVSWLLKHAHPLIKVTIVPRGQSLGAAWYLPEERSITTTEQILDEMCATMGGRAAEKITFGKISTGALSDLEKVTKQAYAMVSMYGLNDKIGNISYYDSRGQESFTKPYSEATARIIDEEASKIIEEQYQRALQILADNQQNLVKLAEKLLVAEVIFKEDLEEIFGKREFDTEGTELLAELVPADNVSLITPTKKDPGTPSAHAEEEPK
ncbi:ATP-dependent zinc metalloprotease FtsH [Pedobacter frigiditerrae]|uniref:ATP-dependent zinc metalloprotease FtsH n=1 Tax=Pedobacter frigiditerrae TaxID=2530452 RepID=A0A4V2MJC6_9SPHI|nr:ATP-dependent zinc metalloprotease FtsH [Pedobacter frigiditerrae]TCC93746.1 ATP-dependent zinc metalloprotease FtsH [Pedobacter frigiditerrae]